MISHYFHYQNYSTADRYEKSHQRSNYYQNNGYDEQWEIDSRDNYTDNRDSYNDSRGNYNNTRDRNRDDYNDNR